MPHKEIEKRLRRNRLALLTAGLVLLTGMAVTVFLVHRNQIANAQVAEQDFMQEVSALETHVQAQLESPLGTVRALDGLHAAYGKPGNKSLRAWIGALDLPRTAPGIRGIGWLERVPRAALEQFLTTTRKEQGSDFQVNSRGEADPLFVLKDIEPRARNAALWAQDASGQTVLMEALNRAIEQGETVLARSIAPADSPWGKDFFYFMPQFGPQTGSGTSPARAAALTGIWVVRLDADALLLPVHRSEVPSIDFALLDAQAGTASALVYSSESTKGSSHWKTQDFSQRSWHTQRSIVVAGHRFNLHAGSNAAFDTAHHNPNTLLTGIAGLALSALFALASWLLLQARNELPGQTSAIAGDLARLTRIITGSSHVIFVGDAQRDLVWVNDAFTRLTGLESQDAKGQRFDALVDLQANSATQIAEFRRALDQREGLRTQLRMRKPEGEVRWFDVDLQVEHDTHGVYAGYIVIAADITEQRLATDRAAAALRENEALMAVIDQHSIVSIADYRGNITYVNDMFCQISGYSPEELLGSNHRIVKSDQQDDAFWESMWKTISSGYTWRATVCNRAKDGSHYWVDSVISPFFDDAGNIEKYVSIRSNVTAARKAQEDLANEREHLNAILVGTDAGTWEWNVPTGQFVINSRWAEIVGYGLADLGRVTVDTWSELCHPDDLLMAKELLHQHFNGTLKSYSCEIRMRHRDGHWVWVLSSGKVSSWVGQGQPLWVSGIQLDVTVQKNLQFELHQNNQVMQSILANIPVALSVFDNNLQLIARNDKFLELLEFPAWLFEGSSTSFESLIRYNAARGEYGSGDVEQAVQFIIERAWNTVPHQFERVRPNGQALEVRGAPMPGGGFITTYADISERKRAEAEIQRSTNLLQSVLDAASEVAVISIDLEARITLFNKGAEQMFGFSAESVVGQILSLALFDPDEVRTHAEALSAQAGYPISGLGVLTDFSVLGKRTEWTTRHRDGHTFNAAMVVTPMSDSNGKRSGYLCVSFNITQEKKNEQALQLAVELAQQAALSKGQFLANMSHEIRTPMNAVLGMLTLLQNTDLDSQQLDYSAKAESAARSLLGLLNDILDYSKAEAGKMQLDPHPFSVSGLVQDLQVILSGNLTSRDIQLVLDVDKQLPDVLVGDALRLQQILINLGGNAIKFTEHGEVLISIQQRMRIDSDVQLRVLVKDSGIGIDPANQEHIFSGFTQAEASTTRRFGGSGLGLSICKRLVELMGGELKLDSALGKGSSFYFDVTLPIATAEQVADMPPPVSMKISSSPPVATARNGNTATEGPTKKRVQRLAGMRLLVVEDNLINQQVAKELLGAEGASITLAGNGQLGVEAVATSSPPFDAVLMDMQMPVMDGFAAARAIRLELGLTNLPIIAVTANAMPSDREACIAAGMNDHIGKPFDLPRLIALLMRYTGRDGMADPVNTASMAAAPAPADISATDGVAAAIERLGGNEELYLQILQAFLLDIAALPAQLETLLSQRDFAAATRLLHTTKGLSLTVGAEHLSHVCKDGEATLKNSPEDPDLGARVRQAVEATVSRLEIIQKKLADKQPVPALPEAKTDPESDTLANLRSLQKLLEASNLQALQDFAEMNPSTTLLGSPEWSGLQSAMMALDFEKAMLHCNTLIDNLA